MRLGPTATRLKRAVFPFQKAPGNRQTIGDDKRRVLIMFKGVEQPGIRTVIC
jgi:hypothetical protein